MKCPYCETIIKLSDFFDQTQKTSRMFGSFTDKHFKGNQIYGMENSTHFSNLRTLHRFWECPACGKLLSHYRINTLINNKI